MPPSYSGKEEHEQRSIEHRCKLACDECRKRKLRCDGQQPQCGICADTGIPCRVNPKRSTRGPKKGLLKALRLQTAELKRRLEEGEIVQGFPVTQPSRGTGEDRINMDVLVPTFSADILLPNDSGTILRESPSSESRSQAIENLSDITLAELNQLYFERVHPFTPFLQKRRFLSWAQQPNLKGSRLSLRLAMWTLAAMMSAQYQQIDNMLYQQARKSLESLELQLPDIKAIDVEQAQAWLLIAIYELTRMHYSQGWISVGRACRLVQLMSLHKIDAVEKMTSDATLPPFTDVETEERRRTFWMAYCLDRIIGIRNDWPIAFSELVNGEAVVGEFLSEEIAAECDQIVPSFTELIVFVTIGARCLSHKQQAVVEPVYGNGAQDFWNRHHWLHSLLTQRIRRVSRIPTLSSLTTDPMRLFANMVAQTALIYLYRVMNLSPSDRLKEQTMPGYEEEARAAAKEIVSLTKFVDELSIFKVC
ncbi:hypothetical protein N7481_000278 [Penicillium waksmanii]|uniref:uncharacterized protein n=1 Tax=Penicillium waksmanii TaxID=69791 RepID=UPI002547DF49|nr:uncharacterized protein N7481_000278 [Penicillium waksmanii]KAJ5999869.1 hypothetical protein N7481_000278 [Penicillium waksmanii]